MGYGVEPRSTNLKNEKDIRVVTNTTVIEKQIKIFNWN